MDFKKNNLEFDEKCTEGIKEGHGGLREFGAWQLRKMCSKKNLRKNIPV